MHGGVAATASRIGENRRRAGHDQGQGNEQTEYQPAHAQPPPGNPGCWLGSIDTRVGGVKENLYRIDNITLTQPRGVRSGLPRDRPGVKPGEACDPDVRDVQASGAVALGEPGAVRGEALACEPARLAAAAIAVARHRYGPARSFAEAIGLALEGRRMTRQAIYLWETGANRVPAAALIVAAQLVGLSVQDLLAAADRFATKQCPEGADASKEITAERRHVTTR